MIVIYPWLGDNTLDYDFLADSFHHYQLGSVLIVLGGLFYRRLARRRVIYFAISIALVVEEYVVILSDVGLWTGYRYLSGADNVVLYTPAALVALGAYGVKRWRAAYVDRGFEVGE